VDVAVKITFRPTARQVLGRALLLSSLALVAALVPAVAYMLAAGRWYYYTLLALFLFAIAIALGVAYAGARNRGVMLDERGIHPIKAVASQKHTERFAAWTDIADIRAERRASRTVPVVYLLDPDQKPWRLQAPYSGRALSTDDELDEKIFVMRSLWDAYKRGRPPYRRLP
jgi:hypothetical protein